MRKRFHDLAEKGRITDGRWASPYGARYGAFMLLPPNRSELLKVIVSAGDVVEEIPGPKSLLGQMGQDAHTFPNGTRWDHVSVSLKDRTPNWEEMAWVKSLFWDDEELVVEYHPPKSKYINVTATVLHLWKPLDFEIPLPPSNCV